MIMVTGATGFLGAHVLFELVSKGYPVKALFRDQHKIVSVKRVFGYYVEDITALWNRIEWVQGDVLDYFSLMEQLNGVTEVYHTAGMVSFNNRDKEKLNHINIQGTANLVNACLELGIEKLCHVSSIATLGESNDSQPIDENMFWNPGASASAYAISKFRSEMEVWRGIHEGLKAVIVNPSVIIGPGMWMGSARQLLDRMNEGLNYYPQGSGGYVDVRDVASAMIKLSEGDCFGDRYIVNAENISHRHLLNHIADAMNRPRPSRPITPFLLKTVTMFEAVRSAFTGYPPRITRKALEIATEEAFYSNRKIKDTVDIQFITVEESVKLSMPFFLSETASAN